MIGGIEVWQSIFPSEVYREKSKRVLCFAQDDKALKEGISDED
jgi:hypothetical protein